MASTVLDRKNAEKGDLPAICAKCGEKATTQVETTFASSPTWFPVPAIAQFIFLNWATVKLPLCEAHKGMWFWDRVQLVGLCCAVLVCVALGNGIVEEIQRESGSAFGLIPTLIYIVGFAALIGLLFLFRTTIVRAGSITATRITLKGVAKEFADAIEVPRQGRLSSGED